MAIFAYKIRDAKGKSVSGTIDAVDLSAAADKLRRAGFVITSLLPKQAGIDFNDLFPSLDRIKTEEMVMYTIQLSSMLNAGITLPAALRILGEQTENKKLKLATQEISQSLKEGSSFSDALKSHPTIFSNLFVNMAAAGEVSGNLEEILKRLAYFAEKESELKQKVTTALFYPLILAVLGVVIIVYIITSVLPSFIKIFTTAGVPLPLPTQILFVANIIIQKTWLYILIGLGGLILLYNYYNSTPVGRYVLDKIKFKIPLVGTIIKKVLVARFCRSLATLLSSGVPMLQSLSIVEKTVDNAVLSNVLKRVYSAVSKGENLSSSLAESGEFPTMTLQMIAVGEETGNLDSMLSKTADFYEMLTDYSVKRLTTLLEPIFLIVIGGMAGFIFASILLPMFRMMGTMKH